MSDELLVYPRRDYGMDHDRYAWSMLQDRPPVAWPDGKPLALWINLSLQHFPLSGDKPPVAPPGALTMPYPDLRHYTLAGLWQSGGHIPAAQVDGALSGRAVTGDIWRVGRALPAALGAARNNILGMAGPWLEHAVDARG